MVIPYGCIYNENLPLELNDSYEVQEEIQEQKEIKNEPSKPTEIKDDVTALNKESIIIKNRALIEENEGEISILVTGAEFSKLGIEYGDSIDLIFSNGFEMINIPYYNQNYMLMNEVILVGDSPESNIRVLMSFGGNVWSISGINSTDTVTIVLKEKEKYTGVIINRTLQYSNNRLDYQTDAEFANFRSVKAQNIKEGILYRSASPNDNMIQRASYADSLMLDAKIAFVLNLAEDDEKIIGNMSKEDYKSHYYKSLYDNQKVKGLLLNADYGSDDFKKKIAEGLIAMSESEGPYLIHCLEGKERTAFVCLLLEGLCDADYEEIKEDYMISYENYYGINEKNQKENYDLLVKGLLDTMIQIIVGDNDLDLKNVDLKAGTERYLLEGGMSPEQIELLRSRLIR